MNLEFFIHIFNILLTIACTITWIAYWIRYRAIGVLVPLSWLFNFFLYNITLCFFPSAPVWYTHIWEILLTTHAIGLLMLASWLSTPKNKRLSESKQPKIRYKITYETKIETKSGTEEV